MADVPMEMDSWSDVDTAVEGRGNMDLLGASWSVLSGQVCLHSHLLPKLSPVSLHWGGGCPGGGHLDT